MQGFDAYGNPIQTSPYPTQANPYPTQTTPYPMNDQPPQYGAPQNVPQYAPPQNTPQYAPPPQNNPQYTSPPQNVPATYTAPSKPEKSTGEKICGCFCIILFLAAIVNGIYWAVASNPMLWDWTAIGECWENENHLVFSNSTFGNSKEYVFGCKDYDNHALLLASHTMTHSRAEQFCGEEGAEIAKIQDGGRNDKMIQISRQKFHGQGLWINTFNFFGHWTNLDGYKNWYRGQPDNFAGTEWCAGLFLGSSRTCTVPTLNTIHLNTIQNDVIISIRYTFFRIRPKTLILITVD